MKHIEIRYFFVTDRINRGKITPEWCLTDKMVADFMTKPLQGKQFIKFHDIIMGIRKTEDVSESGKYDRWIAKMA
jgi:hypothetical protein